MLLVVKVYKMDVEAQSTAYITGLADPFPAARVE